MRNGLLGAALGVVIATLVGYLVWGGAGDPVQRKPRNAVITLTQDSTTGAPLGRCVASIDTRNMGGSPGEPLKWCIVDGEGEEQTNQCRPPGAWAVWLVFEGNGSPFEQPNQARRVRVGRGCKIPRIDDEATIGQTFDYKVFMQPGVGEEYEIVDPDIEIEPPM